MKTVTIIPSSSTNNVFNKNDNTLELAGISLPSDANHEVLAISNVYKEIFGKTKKTSSNHKKRISIVKISANGHSIYRSYRSISARDFDKKFVALTYNSLLLLSNENGDIPNDVQLSDGSSSFYKFYWNHPNVAISISVRLGILSIIISVFSLLISVISLFH